MARARKKPNLDDIAPRARKDDPQTSHEAAERMKRIAPLVREFVLLSIGRFRRATVAEICGDLKVHGWSISPRPVELERLGLIRRSGKKACLNFNGKIRDHNAWEITPAGWAEVTRISRRRNPPDLRVVLAEGEETA